MMSSCDYTPKITLKSDNIRTSPIRKQPQEHYTLEVIRNRGNKMIKENLVLFLNTIQDSNRRTATEVEFCRERYAVHRIFGLVVKCDFIVGGDGAGQELAVDVYPCVFRH